MGNPFDLETFLAERRLRILLCNEDFLLYAEHFFIDVDAWKPFSFISRTKHCLSIQVEQRVDNFVWQLQFHRFVHFPTCLFWLLRRLRVDTCNNDRVCSLLKVRLELQLVPLDHYFLNG